MSEARTNSTKRAGSIAASITLGVVRFALVVALLGGGAYVAWWFNQTTPAKKNGAGQREEASRQVEIVVVERRDQPVRVEAMGAVMPALEAVIRPRVEGMVVEVHDEFVPGGFFERGTFMAQLDRVDYEQALEQRESDLAQAEAALKIELGDQAVAREELELLEVDIPEINRDLILRKPQVAQARARVRSSEAAVARAEMDLERTRLVAPFDGHVVERSVTLGNNVSVGEAMATFVGSSEYWIELAIPVPSLRWIEAGDGDGAGGAVRPVAGPLYEHGHLAAGLRLSGGAESVCLCGG